MPLTIVKLTILNHSINSKESDIILLLMILVTGGTGFIGRTLVHHLISSGQEVRTLLRPSKTSPHLPRGIAVDAAVSSLLDERSLRAALRGVDTIFHLAGNERHSSRARLQEVDIQGTQVLVEAASQAGVKHILYVSHLGADQNSAFPVLKAKGLAEHAIIQSGVPYTVLRSSILFGPGDQFTTGIARLLRSWPGPFLLPGDGSSLVQPLWIEDLVACLLIALDAPTMMNQVISVGGVEAMPFRQVVQLIMAKINVNRQLSSFSPPYLRMGSLMLEQIARSPISFFLLDYLAADRTTNLDTLPRIFGILPARFHTKLDYLVYKKRGLSTLKQGLY